ncbi:MAG TPA: hypothetical protein VIQ29_12750 [Ancylobacter sp.]
MSDVFDNAIVSIQLGIEDFQSNDERRPVSALRNFYAGVLLLGKQCLLNAAPDDLDPMKVLGFRFTPALDDDDEIIYEPKGQQTIDLNDLQGRFRSFKLKWPDGDIGKLQRHRNDIEHYHSTAPKEVIREAIVGCFPLVEGFFSILGKSPKEYLGDAWDVMLEERAFFKMLQAECLETFEQLPWWEHIDRPQHIQCPECRTSLIYQQDASNRTPENIKARCKSCGEELSAEQAVEIIVNSTFRVDEYSRAKDGIEDGIHDCPECFNNTYVDSGEIAECFFCGYKIEGDCARCGAGLTISTMSVNNSSLCDYCDHMSSKDD